MNNNKSLLEKNKILVLGGSGLVGSRYVELHKDKNELLTPTLEEFNFLNPKLIEKYLKDKNISAVINFAAYTDVGEAEKERGDKKGMCWKINVEGIKNLCNTVDKNIYFIQISTDMVFLGSVDDPGPYKEDHKLIEDPEKLTWYGYTKGEGERIIAKHFKIPSILRIMYPVRAKFDQKLDYLRKLLKLYIDGNLYPLFSDQQISITFIDEACKVLNIMISDKKTGIYHCSSYDLTSPFEITNYLIEAKYRVKGAVKCISINEFLKNMFNPVRYPIFGGLKVEKSENILGVKYLGWKDIVNVLIKQNISIKSV